ncbi:hypothetical protein HGH92_17925 [Chitinophaga varians]|uniref:Uncharacterized protein n=1 Tax=Chitinophaga varians TaxID=2202339 RepID=A0A847RTA0_9BACT|nr:hypothetical protein [Chitinophaga varians]NLR66192.1 hypothetical protein [Chitinophaga varians]
MKKLLFLTTLSLFLGLIPFSTAQDAKATAYVRKATQEIWFNITYSYNGQWVSRGHITILSSTSGSQTYTFFAGGIVLQANIGDYYSIVSDDLSPASGGGIITDTNMNVTVS